MPTTLVLRARPDLDGVEVGTLMASQTGKSVYRVSGVVRVHRQDGERKESFVRLILQRLRPADVPPGAVVRPWRLALPAPPAAVPAAVSAPPTIRRTAPTDIAQRRRQDQAAQLARVRRIGREEATGFDLGPEVRRRIIRDRDGRLLRDADCAVMEDVPDPKEPNRTLRRRAYRSDPILALKRAGSIGEREVNAAEDLREWLEIATPRLGGFNDAGGVHVSPFDRLPVLSGLLGASLKLRRLSEALGQLWEPALWVCAGGTVLSFSEFKRLRMQTATDLVRDGLKALANQLYGPIRKAA